MEFNFFIKSRIEEVYRIVFGKDPRELETRNSFTAF
jgi:hypothetical protein